MIPLGSSMPLNLNRASLSSEIVNVAVNDAIERATAAKAELPRPYLGASIVGNECLRKVQFDWWCKPMLSSRVRDIFERGHYFEDVARQHLTAAGFKLAPPDALAFSAVNGDLRGHGRWNHHRRPEPAQRRLLQLPLPVGAQGDQCEKLACNRARRTRESFPAIRCAGRALPSLSRQDQSGAVHSHQCRHL
jgi:hypothetical protein